jgi:hypothetical protein
MIVAKGKKLAANDPFKEHTSLSSHMRSGIIRKMRSFKPAASITSLLIIVIIL